MPVEEIIRSESLQLATSTQQIISLCSVYFFQTFVMFLPELVLVVHPDS